MYYDKIEFNHEYIAGLSLADFTEQYKGKFFLNQPEGIRIEKLSEVWEGCKAATNSLGGEAAVEPAVPAPAPKVEKAKAAKSDEQK